MAGRGGGVRLGAAVAALAVACAGMPALADGGWGGGLSISYSSGWSNNGCFSVGYASPVYAYSGPRSYRGGYYGGSSYYYNDCAPRYYPRPSYREYYYRPAPRYYYNDCAPRYYRNNCGPGYYWSGGYAVDGYHTARADGDDVLRFRNETYAGDPNFAPAGGFKVVRNTTELERAAELDPQWAGGAIAMLRKGEANAAVVALEQAAYPENFGVDPSAFAGEEPGVSGAALDRATVPAGNPEAVRMLGLAMIAGGQIDEGAAKIVDAYRIDPMLASTPIDERLFPSSARLDVRDLIRKVAMRANRTNAPEAWFALGVLMQAEDRDSVALDMVLKASAAGLDQSIVSPMADALRRVVYGRG